MFDLTGRTALVTGAGQGVGRAVAAALAAQGARVVVNDIDPDRAGVAADEIAADGRADTVAAPFDVTDLDAVQAAVAAAGEIDILVNNAGNAGAQPLVPTPFAESDPATWSAPVDVNLYGVLNCSHAVLGGMRERGWGRIITISSAAGTTGLNIGVATYGAGKGGALAFMRHLAVENARAGVTANSLALGLMELPDPAGREFTEAMARTIPVGRVGTGADVGAACVWLASEEAAWVTGQTIGINGGADTT